jgi:hypothetical protein
MKILRASILVILIAAGLLLSAPRSDANPAFFYGYATSHPGYAYYHPWAWSFGFGYSYPTYVWNYYPYGYGYGAPYPGYAYYPVAGEIRAEVKPNNAKVYVNGDYAGVVDDYDGWWQRLKVAPGKWRIVFRAPGYTPYVVDMRIVPGAEYHIKYQMTPGNDVLPDEQMKPERNPRDEQYYRHRDQNRDYGQDRQQDRDQDRDPGYQRDQNYGRGENDRASNTQTLYLQVEPADATIYIDGNYYGTAAQGPSELKVLLPKGSHKIEIVRPGYKAYSNDVELGPGSDDHLNVTLEPK